MSTWSDVWAHETPYWQGVGGGDPRSRCYGCGRDAGEFHGFVSALDAGLKAEGSSAVDMKKDTNTGTTKLAGEEERGGRSRNE